MSESRFPKADLTRSSHFPLYQHEDERMMEPALFGVFMQSAANAFQDRAAKDLMEQGVPEKKALKKAFTIAGAFKTLATALYENNLGIGRAPRGGE